MPGTTFDADGICNNCHDFDRDAAATWHPNEVGAQKLEASIQAIKDAGKGKEYDCLLGLSGGVDSSFLALRAKEWGLRPLVFHVDAGWNSEMAVQNINAVVQHCDYDLFTDVVDWETMADLQAAYFRSGVVNQDVPQDHVFFASLFKYSRKFGVKAIVSGHNFATESVKMRWQHNAMDSINLRAIHRKFGQRKLTGYTTISFLNYYLVMPILRGVKFYAPLNMIPYDKEVAITELKQIGWQPYGHKHGESIFTKFFQEYYLPEKYRIDKRRAHFSSLVLAGSMTRDEAVEAMKTPPYDPEEMRQLIPYFRKKVGISKQEFDDIMAREPHKHTDFANWNWIRNLATPFGKMVRAARMR